MPATQMMSSGRPACFVGAFGESAAVIPFPIVWLLARRSLDRASFGIVVLLEYSDEASRRDGVACFCLAMLPGKPLELRKGKDRRRMSTQDIPSAGYAR